MPKAGRMLGYCVAISDILCQPSGVNPRNNKTGDSGSNCLLQYLRQAQNQWFQIEMTMGIDHAAAIFRLQMWLFGIHCYRP